MSTLNRVPSAVGQHLRTFVDGEGQNSLAQTNRKFHKRVLDDCTRGYSQEPDLKEALQLTKRQKVSRTVSQQLAHLPRQLPPSRSASTVSALTVLKVNPQDEKRAAARKLVERILQFPNGREFVNLVTKEGKVSVLHRDSMSQLAKAEWDAKIAGLFAYIQAASIGLPDPAHLKQFQYEYEKFQAILDWMKENSGRLALVQELQVGDLETSDMDGIIKPDYDPRERILHRIPEEALSFSPNLQTLVVNRTRLNTLPRQMPAGLKMIDLSFNEFKRLPKEIGSVQELTEFKLCSNEGQLHLDADCFLWQARNLTLLNLSCDKISAIPEEIRNLKKLKVLVVSGNNLTKMSHLSELPELVDLHLERNGDFEDINDFFLSVAQQGRAGIRVYLDARYARFGRLPELTAQLAEMGYRLSIVKDTNRARFHLIKNSP